MGRFKLNLPFPLSGDQPAAVKELTDSINSGEKFNTLLGVTGSGKTVTMASVIENVDRPTLVMSHNKTLAAQLYGELRQFFPENAVEFFVSYYDYYQPEAYVPSTDTFIEKDSSINENIEKLRLRATSSLLSRSDTIVVASVSCIYGLGDPETYESLFLKFEIGDEPGRRQILEELVAAGYNRNDTEFERGTFRVRGDVVEVFPAYEEYALRIELWGDEIERVSYIDPLKGTKIQDLEKFSLFPASHFVTPRDRIEKAVERIEKELKVRLTELAKAGKLVEAQRLEQRTRFDIEMLLQAGICQGIENYSRHLSGREEGERPACLLDYFPDDFLVMVDESHVSVPQVRGMYNGDRARKMNLVEHGFRLPSALDNRPLQFDEWEKLVPQAIFVSATPGPYELEKTHGVVTEQIIRPTGLLDPQVEVRPVGNQVDDLLGEIREREKKSERVLVTTLTKKMAEDLSEYLRSVGVKVKYMHADIDTIERMEILRELRLGEFDVLVGINLLREGLDLPEVSLVAILDADKEGFLRNERSLVQTMGRAARNVEGKAILYADRITDSMKRAMDETDRRRAIQHAHNVENNITPATIKKSVEATMLSTQVAEARKLSEKDEDKIKPPKTYEEEVNLEEWAKILESQMMEASEKLDFERAAELRDELQRVKLQLAGS